MIVSFLGNNEVSIYLLLSTINGKFMFTRRQYNASCKYKFIRLKRPSINLLLAIKFILQSYYKWSFVFVQVFQLFDESLVFIYVKFIIEIKQFKFKIRQRSFSDFLFKQLNVLIHFRKSHFFAIWNHF